MDREFEEKLEDKYFFMKRSCNNLRESNPYDKEGCQCCSGWYLIINNMCQEILDRYNTENEAVDLVVEQIKEKWGSLRFYYSFQDKHHFPHAFDSMDGTGIRIYPGSHEEDFINLRRDIADIVRKYENLSKLTCEL